MLPRAIIGVEDTHMELLQLKYFCAAAECESFSAVAERFSVPPSAVSQSIKRLEGELGVSLFFRRPNRVMLTDEGRLLAARAGEALSLLSDAVSALHDREGEGQIRICINTNRRAVVEAIERYKRLYPAVEIVATHLAPPDPRAFDLIVDSEAARPEGCDGQLLVEEELLLAVPASSPYASRERISLAELAEEPFVTMGERSGLSKLLYELCRAHGFAPRVTIRSDDPHYVRRCVELGLGVTLSPAFSWRGQFSPDAVLRPIGGYRRRTYLYTPRFRRLPRAAREFIRVLLAECADAR